MATTIKMPQLGESVTEGTIERWLVKEGDRVDQYDPLFEVVTDKVNAEVPAEVAGTITKIIVGDGQTVKVGTPLAEIDAGDAAGAETAAPAAASEEPASPPPAEPAAPPPAEQQTPSVASGPATDASVRMTPAVRRLVREHDLDISRITGTGSGGRVTRDDVLAFVAGGDSQPAAPPPAPPRQPAPATPPAPPPPPPHPPRSGVGGPTGVSNGGAGSVGSGGSADGGAVGRMRRDHTRVAHRRDSTAAPSGHPAHGTAAGPPQRTAKLGLGC